MAGHVCTHEAKPLSINLFESRLLTLVPEKKSEVGLQCSNASTATPQSVYSRHDLRRTRSCCCSPQIEDETRNKLWLLCEAGIGRHFA